MCTVKWVFTLQNIFVPEGLWGNGQIELNESRDQPALGHSKQRRNWEPPSAGYLQLPGLDAHRPLRLGELEQQVPAQRPHSLSQGPDC